MFSSLSSNWQVCIEQAWEGYCVGSLPIGAVVVNETGNIIAKGRNRIWDETLDENQKVIFDHRLAHAEINALLAADFRAHEPKKCILYTLAEPCPLCVGAIVMANLVRYGYAARCNWAGSTELLQASGYMRSKGVKAEGPWEGVFERAVVAWQLEYNLWINAERAEQILKANEASLPESVVIARRLHQEGILQSMKREGKTAQDVFDELCRHVENRV
jgi:tRNA(adenine34) deaminase